MEGKREDVNKEKEKKVREDTEDNLMTGKEERNGQEGRAIEREKIKKKGRKESKERNRKEKRDGNDEEQYNRMWKRLKGREETLSSNDFSQLMRFEAIVSESML